MNHYLINSERKLLREFLLILVCFLFSNSVLAEDENSSIANLSSVSSKKSSRLAKFKAAARARLIKKLTNRDGKMSKIIILSPVDYTPLQETTVAAETIKKSILAYDPKIQVEFSNYQMEALTLENFRKAILGNEADVIVTLIMHPTNFDIYLYDARAPYQIYAHSEPISTGAQYELNKEAVQHFTKILIRRTLYRYIKNQYYELPREEVPTVLQTEIPRHIASEESLAKINREAHSNWYTMTSLGAALSTGKDQSRWMNSSVFSGALGRRIWDNYYLEAGIELSAYNVFSGFGRYLISDKNEPFKTSIGLGMGYVTSRHTLGWDWHDNMVEGTIVGGISGSVLLPVGDVYLKAEGRLYLGLNNSGVIFNLLPGLLLVF